jgi:large subunit ribosomal protein L18
MKKLVAVQFTRKRKRVTNYRSRLKLVLSGKERLVIRKTSRSIIVQFTKFDAKGDMVVTSVSSNQLKKYGWTLGFKNLPAAYLTGLLAGKLALAKNLKEAVLDAGVSKPSGSGRVYAALKGVIDSGIKVPSGDGIFPPEERLSGLHISSYMGSSKSANQFSLYKKMNTSPEKMKEIFSSVKTKITGGKNG